MSVVPYVGLSEVVEDKVGCAKALVAEVVGTMMLVLVGCGSCSGGDDKDSDISDQANIVRIALTFGITVATIAQAVGHVSGCHINPAVTAGLIVGQKIGIVKGLLYVLAQSLGAILGASILVVVLPQDNDVRGVSGLGVTGLSNVSPGQGFGIELLITMVLVLVVFGAAADPNNEVRGSAPLAIGLSITAAHLWAIPYTGSSMNPARSLGPSVVTGDFNNHWVYWVGPISGGVLAAILYQLVFQAAPKKDKYQGVAAEEKILEDKV